MIAQSRFLGKWATAFWFRHVGTPQIAGCVLTVWLRGGTIAVFKTERGEPPFTWVELLVVLGVLAVLIAIVVPNLAGITGGARTTAAETELDIVQTAMDILIGETQAVTVTMRRKAYAARVGTDTAVEYWYVSIDEDTGEKEYHSATANLRLRGGTSGSYYWSESGLVFQKEYPVSTPMPTLTPATRATSTATSTPTKEVTATPETTPTPVSTGRLEVTYPLEMIVEESDMVTVEIMADPGLAETETHPVYASGVIIVEVSSQDKVRDRIEKRIKLYPVMSVELIASNFDIMQGDADARRAITTAHSASWTWSIAARKPGMQRITINVFGEAVVTGEKFIVLEKSISRNINVLDKSLPKKILDGLY